ncbi:hypothetical protein ABLE68_05670 [Nocardioides sp. CN2-186]|uniref:hypothetical protein n=1 Tax=Nocardioides tweenelious TaxID=3156607 RepID=UPI0032B34594
MRPYLYAFASIWGTWFACLVAASVHADASTDATALDAPYLVWFLGVAASVLLTVVAFLAIAGAQCLEAAERRRT